MGSLVPACSLIPDLLGGRIKWSLWKVLMGKRPKSLSPRETLFSLSLLNRTLNLLDMIGKRVFQKIGRSIMGCRKYLALERRRQPRYPIAIDAEFYVGDKVTKNPLTAKVTGRLVDISGEGARLQTNAVRIGYHHLVISGGLEGKSAVILEFPTSSEGMPWILKTQILWYNTIGAEGEFKFEFGIVFVDISLNQKKCLESVIKSI